jgi:hypothetical protein
MSEMDRVSTPGAYLATGPPWPRRLQVFDQLTSRMNVHMRTVSPRQYSSVHAGAHRSPRTQD